MKALLLSLGMSLALTLVLELGFALLWGVKRADLPLAALVNLLTNPVVVLCRAAVLWLWPAGVWAATLLLEAGAVLVEGGLYHSRSEIRFPWAFSLCANLFSFTIGLLL